MRKGVFSFVIYIIYALLGGGMVLYNYIAIQKHNAEGGGLEGIGLALLFVIGIILGAAGLLGVILKGIQLGTGWGFFGFLCMILDLVFIGAFISMVLPGGNNIEAAQLSDFLPMVPFIAASFGSFIANAISLKR